MFCTKCGAEVSEGQKFCPKCGSQMQQMTSNNSSDVTTVSNTTGVITPKLIIDKKIIIGAIAVIIVLVLIIALPGKSKDKKNKAKSNSKETTESYDESGHGYSDTDSDGESGEALAFSADEAAAKILEDFNSVSKKGLIDKLVEAGYSKKEATAAAEGCGADWNANAARSAWNTAMFADDLNDLYSKLISDGWGFTEEEAKYAISHPDVVKHMNDMMAAR